MSENTNINISLTPDEVKDYILDSQLLSVDVGVIGIREKIKCGETRVALERAEYVAKVMTSVIENLKALCDSADEVVENDKPISELFENENHISQTEDAIGRHITQPDNTQIPTPKKFWCSSYSLDGTQGCTPNNGEPNESPLDISNIRIRQPDSESESVGFFGGNGFDCKQNQFYPMD